MAYKRWKLTEHDWGNRENGDAHELAVHDMVERTSTSVACWVLFGRNGERYARSRALTELADRCETSTSGR